ncbi:MAG: OPT/YSL family transporter, partial [Candidatus Micrarchaeota archaeon]|nr:OPT/YSL family transporter [Candidatus Micrarchaeota archaeon]
TTAVVSLALVRVFSLGSKHDTNVMQTAASTGGLLAAGIIFTIPAIFMLGFSVGAGEIVLVALAGGLIGLLFVYPLRQSMVVEEKLPYADGAAAAAIISAGDKGGKQSKTLIGSFGLGAIYAALNNTVMSLPFSFIPIAGGYLIGARFMLAWFAGALITLLYILPNFGATAISAVAQPLGVGIVIGAAIASFITVGIPVFMKTAHYYRKAKMGKLSGIAFVALCLLLVYAFDLSLPLALLAIIGAFLMAFIGARITGEMNVDPMEIFALILLLAAKFIFGFSAVHLVLLAAVVCIAAGIAGDAMQDFKTGFLLGTPPQHQFAAEIAGVISASLVMGVLMLSFAHTGFGGKEFPAPQAIAVKEIASAGALPQFLAAGAVVGFLLALAGARFGLGAVPIALGIGLYVPFSLSLPLFIGGMARYFIDRAKQTEKWRLVAGGLIAGEGLVGAIIVIAAAAKFFGI